MGNEKKTLFVSQDIVDCGYFDMHEPPEPPTYCGDPGPPQEATFKILRYKITGWVLDFPTGDRVFQATRVE